jgi:glycosyltransferase involved in cell wall biosynthesis
MHIGEKNIFFENIYTYAIKKSTKIIVLSQGFISQIINKYGILQENICWIPHANFNYYIPLNDDCSVKNKIFNKILFFGRIYEYKGLSVLLKAMNILEKTNKNICLKIVGSGKLSKEEKILIEKLGDKVELINRWINEDDVHSFFKDIDLTVLPYIEASQSGVIVLSYGMKKPVIASDIGGLPEQILPNTGILVPPGNEKILAQTIIDLYKTPEKIIEMGNNAYEYAANELTWERSAEKLINFMT